MSSDRVAELERTIAEMSQVYYSGETEISDDTFDSLVDELRELSPESEVLKKVGWGFEPQGRKVNHLYDLYIGSLTKYKSVESVPHSFKKSTTRVTAKLDGLSVVSYYDHGDRFLSVTRGNGTEGIDVTDKINIISPETQHLNDREFDGAVRGEVLIDNETWRSISDRFKDNPSANQRNFASGVMNRQSTDKDHCLLRYVCYKVLASRDCIVPLDRVTSPLTRRVHSWLINNKFDVAPTVTSEVLEQPDAWSEENFKKYYQEFCKTFPCDGLVLTKDDIKINLFTGTFEYDEIAFKFQAESKKVVVTDVTYEATRTGRMAPRVWFNPLELSGAMVKKATAFNAQFIKDNKINVGTVLEVCRSGEVIPHILKVVEPSSEGLLPDICPNCGSRLHWSGTDLICPNEVDSQLPYNFISTAAPVDGAGWRLYSSVIEVLRLCSSRDLYEFLYNLILENEYEDYYKKLCDKISGSVTQLKVKEILRKLLAEVDPVRFLVACNIPGVSWNSAESLLSSYPQFIDDLKDHHVDYDKVLNIKGLGWSFVESVRSREDKIRDLASVLKISNYNGKQVVETRFNVAITGSLSIKRADFDAKLSEKGILQTGNLKECKYLITNNPNSTSSKMKNAQKYGVEVISEQEFARLYL